MQWRSGRTRGHRTARLEHRAGPVIVVQRDGFEDPLAVRADGAEACGGMVVDANAGAHPKALGQYAHVLLDPRGGGIEGDALLGAECHHHRALCTEHLEQSSRRASAPPSMGPTLRRLAWTIKGAPGFRPSACSCLAMQKRVECATRRMCAHRRLGSNSCHHGVAREEEATMHPVGERLRCDECGAEIVFVQACPCPETEHSTHPDICCDKQMRSLGVGMPTEPTRPEAGH